MTTQLHKQSHPHADPAEENLMASRTDRLSMFLESHFGVVSMRTREDDDMHVGEMGHNSDGLKLVVNVDGVEATIDLLTLVCFTSTSLELS